MVQMLFEKRACHCTLAARSHPKLPKHGSSWDVNHTGDMVALPPGIFMGCFALQWWSQRIEAVCGEWNCKASLLCCCACYRERFQGSDLNWGLFIPKGSASSFCFSELDECSLFALFLWDDQMNSQPQQFSAKEREVGLTLDIVDSPWFTWFRTRTNLYQLKL